MQSVLIILVPRDVCLKRHRSIASPIDVNLDLVGTATAETPRVAAEV